MEPIVTLIALALIAVGALKFGYDSRERIQSKEEELACLGMQWPEPTLRGTRRPARRLAAVRRAVRHGAAVALLALAAWLNPEPAVSNQRSAIRNGQVHA